MRDKPKELLWDFLFTNEEIKRDDTVLVKLVEELGDKIYNDICKLKIVEIPDDIKWYIREHTFGESVEKVHKSWS